jgi:hypothetical protein
MVRTGVVPIDGDIDSTLEPSAGLDNRIAIHSAVPLPLPSWLNHGRTVVLMHDRELREVDPVLGATIR